MTSFLAATTGLVVVNLFRPGVGASLGNAVASAQMPELDTATSGVDLVDRRASGGHAEGDTLSGFEHVIGSHHDDTITGDDLSNWLQGEGGNAWLVKPDSR